jgi:hypothetical protein
MLDPRELTNAEINAVSGGQANSATITEGAEATPTQGSIVIIPSVLTTGSSTVNFVGSPSPGRASTNLSIRQSG